MAAKEEFWDDIHLLYGNRSICYLKIDDLDAALKDADECVRLKPDWSTAYSRRGDALQMQGEYEMARQAYLAGLKHNPTNSNLQTAVKQMDAILGLKTGEERDTADDGVYNDDEEAHDATLLCSCVCVSLKARFLGG